MANRWVVYTNKDGRADAIEVDESISDGMIAKLVNMSVHGNDRVATSYYKLEPGEAKDRAHAIQITIDHDFLIGRN